MLTWVVLPFAGTTADLRQESVDDDDDDVEEEEGSNLLDLALHIQHPSTERYTLCSFNQ